jgi:DNA-binding response OmpR family regulator
MMPDVSPINNIAIVEDHEILREELAATLSREGYSVFTTDCGDGLNKILINTNISIIILDLNLPDEDGLDIIRRVKRSMPHVGIISLTGRIRSLDRVVGYQEGADIYITKPSRPEELVFSVKNLSSRLNRPISTKKVWTLDVKKAILISPENDVVNLSNSEFLVLNLMALSTSVNLYQFQEFLSSSGRSISREQLENLISRLRKKLKPFFQASDELIKSSWGASSYRLCFDVVCMNQ